MVVRWISREDAMHHVFGFTAAVDYTARQEHVRQLNFFNYQDHQSVIPCLFEGTGTRDLIWLKLVSLDRSWLVGLTDDL